MGPSGKPRGIEGAAGKTAENAEKPTIIFVRPHDRKGQPGTCSSQGRSGRHHLFDVNTHSGHKTDAAVVDTQSVLDWLHFADATTAHWGDALRAGRWRWLASQAMRDELAHVLGRGRLPPGRAGRDGAAVLAAFDALAELLPSPTRQADAGLRCTDPDDQKFIDFAIAHGVCWLVSRDRAVLKLGRRMQARHGVEILPPSRWRPGSPRDEATEEPGT